MKKRFNEEQTIDIPRETESGPKPPELFRRHRVLNAAYYNWKSKFDGSPPRTHSA
jgi:putative transposase